MGVCVNSVLSFSEHINNVVAKAKQRTSLLLRSFLSKDAMLLTKAFVVYVRPMLEYCSTVWSLCYIGNINKLENVAIAEHCNLRPPGLPPDPLPGAP